MLARLRTVSIQDAKTACNSWFDTREQSACRNHANGRSTPDALARVLGIGTRLAHPTTPSPDYSRRPDRGRSVLPNSVNAICSHAQPARQPTVDLATEVPAHKAFTWSGLQKS